VDFVTNLGNPGLMTMLAYVLPVFYEHLSVLPIIPHFTIELYYVTCK
jgi:hypothetical protein